MHTLNPQSARIRFPFSQTQFFTLQAKQNSTQYQSTSSKIDIATRSQIMLQMHRQKKMKVANNKNIERQNDGEYTVQEARIMKLMHTSVRDIQQSKIFRIKSTKSHKRPAKSVAPLSPAYITLDIKNPLFDEGYFSKQEKNQKKIELQAKKKKFSFIKKPSSAKKSVY